MLWSVRLRTALLPILVLVACLPKPPPAEVIPPQMPTDDLLLKQEMLVLSLVASAGELLRGPDDTVEVELRSCLRRELQRQPVAEGRWELAWGPAVYRSRAAALTSRLDDNMMFVVRDRRDPGRFAIVIRGTNTAEPFDWFLEDMNVRHLKPWPVGDPPREAAISAGCYVGLNALIAMTPVAENPGGDATARDFLATLVEEGTLRDLDVTGHSLGGTLAPVLALWLADTRATWDPGGFVAIRVIPFAGATPGNHAFATYYDQRLGKTTHRTYQALDVIPRSWSESTLAEIPDLYAPWGIRAPELVRLTVDGSMLLAREGDYTQIMAGTPPLPGRVQLDLPKQGFLEQMGWQHVDGYVHALGIANRFVDVSDSCTE